MSIRRWVIGLAATALAVLALAPSAFADTVFALANPSGSTSTLFQFASTTPGTISVAGNDHRAAGR